MRLDSAAAASYGRHETFHLRHGWARKAVAAAETDPQTFNQDTAMTALGVGRNMVRSIRFWGLAAGLLEPGPEKGAVVPTEYGHTVFGTDGLDPWSESPATAWILHWRLLSPGRCLLPVWWTSLCEHKGLDFSSEALFETAKVSITRCGWELPAASSLRKDVRAFLRSYGTGRTRWLEDEADSVLRQVGLLRRPPDHAPGRESNDVGAWRLDTSYGESVPPWALCHMMADWAVITGESLTVSTERLCSEPGTPAQILRLSTDSIEAVLGGPGGPVEKGTVRLSRSAGGGAMLSWLEEPDKAVHTCLGRCYQ